MINPNAPEYRPSLQELYGQPRAIYDADRGELFISKIDHEGWDHINRLEPVASLHEAVSLLREEWVVRGVMRRDEGNPRVMILPAGEYIEPEPDYELLAERRGWY